MRKRILYFFIFLSVLSAILISGAVKADMISGTVINVDPIASTLVLSYSNVSSGALLNMEFYVPEDALLTGGAETISISDVQISDRVEIEFDVDPMETPVVKRLIDLDRTNRQ